MRARPTHQAPYRFWAPARFRALVSIVAAAAAGIVPAAVVLLPATPAYADPGDIIIEYDLEDLEAGTFTFEIRRVGPTTTPFTLDYATTTVPGAAHHATPDVDFTAISGSTVFSASTRDAVKRITVNGLTDTKDENTEVFGLSLTNVTDPLNNLAIATMNDDDLPPTYSFSTDETVLESAGTVTTTATLGSLSDFPITIPYTTANGTAAAPGDYTTTAGTLSFAPLEDTKTITVPVIDDALDEPAETFTVAASGTPTGATQSVASKTVTVTDNDTPPVVSIATAGSVREGDTLNFPVSINAVSGQAVTVVADTANGTATAPGDYTAVTGQTVTIPAGQTSVNLPVTTVGDANSELTPETLNVALSSPANATLGTTPASGSIVDSVATITAVTPVVEGASGTHDQVFNVTLSAAAAASIDLGYTVTAGTASAGTDFTAGSGTLTYPAGQTVRQITVPVHGDAIYEAGETFNINLTSPGGEVTGGLGANPITIPNDDALPTVTGVSAVSVAEGSGNHTETFTATLSNPSNEDVTLDVTAVDVTAADAGAGVGSNDFNIVNSTVTVPAGSLTADIQVQVNGDAVYEANETANIVATVATGETGATVGSNSSGLLTLTNDDVVPVVTVTSATADENTAAQAVAATVSGSAQAGIAYTVTTANGTAEALDYDATNMAVSGTITPGATSLNLGTIDLLDDLVDDAVDAVNVTVSPTGLVASTGTVTITDASDDTAPEVVGTASVGPVMENAGPAGVPVTLDFSNSAATSTEQTITVGYAMTAGTAKAALDYTNTPGTLTFVPGDTAETASVTLTNDAYFEVDETFTVTLSNAVGAAGLQTAASTVTVSDDDGPAPTFTVTQNAPVTEGGQATFTITMAGPAAVDTAFVIGHTPGTAVEAGSGSGSDDYNPAGTPVTVLKDETTATFTVQTNADTVYEGAETASITAVRDTGVTSVAAGTQTGTLTITDDDAIPTLVLNSVTDAEGGGFDVTATRTGVAEDDMTYTVTVAGDSTGGADAAESGDFGATGSPVTIVGGTAANVVTVLKSVTLNGDTVDENTETLKATAHNDTVTVADATSTYGITDAATNKAPELVYGSAISLAENAGPAAVPVTLDWSGLSGNDAISTEKTITASYTTVDGTAVQPGDYTTASGTLSFVPGDTSESVSVTLANDGVYELSEQFVVRLSAPSGGSTVPVADKTVTVTDDDSSARPTFSVDPATAATVTEGGTVEYKVQLSAAALSDTDFTVGLSGGTAAVNDYTAPAGTVQIAAGATEATISIPLATDNIYEGAETRTLTVDLAGGENDVTGSTQTRTINITDADAIPTLVVNSVNAAEGGGFDVTATRTGVAQNDMTYTVTVAGDSTGGADAAESGDFGATGSPVTIVGGTAANVVTVLKSVTLNGDVIDENTETLKATAHNDTVSTPDITSTYGITDAATNKAPELVYGSAISLAENAGPAAVPVTLDWSGLSGNDATSTEKTITATYATVDGTAAAPGDFTSASGTLSFVPGDTSESVSVTLANDGVYELSEQFVVRLSAPSGGSTVPVADKTVTVTDDDSSARPTFSVDPATAATVTEGGTVEYKVQLSAAAVSDTDFTVGLSGGTAAVNDYTAPAGTVQIAAGATEATISIPLATDNVYEGAETRTLTVALAGGENDVTGSTQTRTINITDADSIPTLVVNSVNAAEGGGFDVTATRTGVAQNDMTYTVTVAGDSTGGADAAESGDFGATGSPVTIVGGTAANVVTVLKSVTLNGDTVDENTETLKATAHNDTVSTPDVTSTYGITDAATNKAPELVYGSSISLAENAGPAAVPVTLDWSGLSGNDATSTEKTITASYTTVDGTAVQPGDYTTASGTLSFVPGDTSESVSVTLANDGVYELSEQFVVRLSAPSGGSTVPVADKTVTVTDDDSSARPTFSVDPATAATVTEGGTVEYKVQLSAAALTDTDFTVGLSGGTAAVNDYTAPAGTVQIAAGATEATISIPLATDNIYEGAETRTLTVDLAGGETDVTGTTQTRTINITDADAIPTLVVNSVDTAEGGGFDVTATRTGVAQNDMTYTVTVAGDSTGGADAAESGDFGATGSPVTIAGGTAANVVTVLKSVTLNGDVIDENTETLKATAHNDTVSTPDITSTYGITDAATNKAPELVYGSAISLAENAGPALVPVTKTWAGLSGNDATSTEKTITAAYTTVDGTAVQPGDYTTATGTLSFAPGDTAQNVSVTLNNDAVYELSEQFVVRLSAPSGGSTVPVADKTVTVTDDDLSARPTFSVDPATAATVTEGGTVEYKVQLSAAALTDTDFTVGLSGGTAAVNDYTAPAGTVQIAAGATEATISIPLTADNVYEGAETRTLTVDLAGGETDVTGTTQTRTINITDANTVPTLTLATGTAAENGSVTINATPSGVAQSDMVYTLTVAGDPTSGADAAENSDYSHALTTVTIPGGSTAGVPISFGSVAFSADTIDENTETIKVTARNDTYGNIEASGLYTITDDAADTAPTASLGAPVTVAEAGTSATVPVTLDFSGSSAATTEKAVTVGYTTASGTATAGTDYTDAPSTVSFTPGVNVANISVPITADSLFETNEDFTVAIASPANATLGTAANTVTITDDDASAIPGFTVSNAVTVTEGAGATAQFTVTLGSAAAGTIDLDASVVDVTTTDGGTLGLGKDDYTPPAADFTIAKDQTTATVSIPIANDTAYEGAESLTLQISLDSGETLAVQAPVSRTVTINDDDAVPTLTMVAADAAENSSVAVTATTSGLAERNMVYALTLTPDVTAGNNPAEVADFTNNPAPATVTGGTASGATVNLGSIPLPADQVDEPVETIRASVHNDTYTTDDVSGLYTITDDTADKPPTVSLGPATVAEGAASAAVPVTLAFMAGNDATSSEQPVSITPQAIPGTAGIDDYGQPVSPQSIPAGTLTGSIAVPIIDDKIAESEETFLVRVNSAGPAGATLGTDTATVTVTDDDQSAVKPTFTVASASVSEGGGGASFTVALSDTATADVDLTVTSQDGTAKEAVGGVGGDDYDRPAGTLRITKGSKAGTFTVPVRQDTVYEFDETARITVALAAGEADATGPAKDVALTITNDDTVPALTLSPSAAGTEGEIVSLSAGIDGVTEPDLSYGTLEISTGTSGDPAEKTDYKLLGGEVVVPGGTPAGGRVDVGSIELAADTVDEAIETLDVALGARKATVRITDDPADEPPTVSVSDASIRETEESVDLKVALAFSGETTGTERTVTVPWRTVAGTAEDGSDFVGGSGTAKFEPGTETVTVNIPITGDMVREEDEQFVVHLGAPAPSDVKVGNADGTVTIQDGTAVRPTLTVASAVVTGTQRIRLSGTAAPGTQVELLSSPNVTGTGGYRVVLTTEADDDGKFGFNPNFVQGYRLYARADGLVSPVRTVEVRQEPTITAVSNATAAATISVTGDPVKAGQTVRVQRLVSGEWDTVATGKLTAAGTYSTTQRGLRSGRSATFRAVISATPSLGILAGTSPTKSVRVR